MDELLVPLNHSNINNNKQIDTIGTKRYSHQIEQNKN